MKFQGMVAAALRKMANAIQRNEDHIKMLREDVGEVMDDWRSVIEKNRNIDVARIYRLEAALIHQGLLDPSGTPCAAPEQGTNLPSSADSLITRQTQRAWQEEFAKPAPEPMSSEERLAKLNELEDAHYKTLHGPTAIRPPHWHA